MSDSPSLALPYLAAAQAQKHVTVNEALSLLDGLVHLTVITRQLSAPPATPIDGDRYLIAAAPTGHWSGHAGHIALRMEGAWRFLVPKEGWRMWVADENTLLTFDGAVWIAASVPSSLQNLSMLGVNATADATNKLAVASGAALFNNIGNGVQIKLNKNTASDSASFLFQTGFSGRAEFGTTGDDNFHLKVSPDGTTFQEAVVVNATSGLTTLKKSLALDPQSGDPVTPVNGQLWYNSTSGKFRAQQNNAIIDVVGGSAAWGAITGTLSSQTDLQTVLNGKAATSHTHTAAQITDFNTAADARVTAGITGKQGNIQFQDEGVSAGTSGGIATLNFVGAGIAANAATSTLTVTVPDTAVWGNIIGTLSSQTDLQTALNGKAAASHAHTLANITDVTITPANLNALDDGVDTALHFHTADRARASHTGTQLASTISDFTTAADARVVAGITGKQANIQFQDEAIAAGTSGGITTVNFTGAGVTATAATGTLTVSIPGGGGGGGQSAIQFSDEGTALGASGAITAIDIKGDDVAATISGTTLTIEQKKYKRNARWSAAGNSATIAVVDGIAFSNGVTPATANVAVTDAFTEKTRAEYLQGTATATAIATARSTAAQWYRGASAGRGGFRLRARVGNATGAANATHRAFFGFQGGITTLTDVNPSTLLNMVGIGWDSGDTNLSVMSNAGSGAATKTSLGASFPRPTTDRSVMWDFELFCAPNDTQIAYKVTNLITGATTSGALTANLPVNTTYLAWHMYASAGGTSSVAGLSFSYLDIASDY